MTQQTPKGKTDFCTMCRQNTGYTLKKQSINKIIKGVEYSFKITVAVCNECGGEMGVPGLIDRNIREIDEHVWSVRFRCFRHTAQYSFFCVFL